MMLVARDLVKHLGCNTVLQDVSLQVEPGEFLGILGPNGSGKSTLLKVLVGEEKPDQGEVYLKGHSLSTMPPRIRAQKVAMLAQEEWQDGFLTVEESVQLGRYPYQGRKPWLTSLDHQVVDKVMKETHIKHLCSRRMGEISGGEKRRVALARVMAQQPQLCMLDEPTSSLDIHHQLHLLDLLKRYQQEEGLTLITVLHDINLAAQYCDRLFLLKEGKVVVEGSVKEVIQPDIIQQVYGVIPLVITHPELKVPQVMLQSNYSN